MSQNNNQPKQPKVKKTLKEKIELLEKEVESLYKKSDYYLALAKQKDAGLEGLRIQDLHESGKLDFKTMLKQIQETPKVQN